MKTVRKNTVSPAPNRPTGGRQIDFSITRPANKIAWWILPPWQGGTAFTVSKAKGRKAKDCKVKTIRKAQNRT